MLKGVQALILGAIYLEEGLSDEDVVHKKVVADHIGNNFSNGNFLVEL